MLWFLPSHGASLHTRFLARGCLTGTFAVEANVPVSVALCGAALCGAALCGAALCGAALLAQGSMWPESVSRLMSTNAASSKLTKVR